MGLLSALFTVLAPGARSEPILPGNLGGFEIDGNQDEGLDANDDDLPTFDWETVRTDPRITQWAMMEDDGLTWINEAKENDPTDWACVANQKESTPKDDLLRVYLASQITADRQLLHIAYVRDEGTGNTDINVEFNQLSADFDPCVGDTDGRIRTPGDLLISFTFGGGNDPATIEVFRWDDTVIADYLGDPPAPGANSDKEPTDGHWDLITTVFGANGADNTVPIVDHFFEGDTIDARTFGEVTINLASLFDDLLTCPGLGFATVHSRASHDMSSDLKDVLPEVPFNLSDCGSLKLKKVNELGQPMAGVTFGLYTIGVNGEKGVLAQLPGAAGEDPTDLTCVTEAPADSVPPTPGLCTFPRVPAGTYILDEVNLPAGYAPDPRLPLTLEIDEFQNIDLSDDDLDKCTPLAVGCEWLVNSRLPDVSVVKTTSTGTVTSGDQVRFQIVVSNAGPGIAEDVTFTDSLPDGITWTITPAVDGCAIDADNDLTCEFDTVAVSATAVTINVVGTARRADCPGIRNPEFGISAGNETTEAAGNNSTPAVPIAVNCPVITVAKVGNGPINAGDNAVYTITVTNNGPGTATDVRVSDTLPAGVQWAGGTPFPVPACGITDNGLSCTFASMAASTTQVIRVVGVTDAADCVGLNNELVSVVTAGGGGANDENTPIVVNCPDMTVVKVGNADPINAGDPDTRARYTITVDNAGDGEANNVDFTDVLPAGLNWTGGAGFPDAACDIETDTRAITGDHLTLTCHWDTFPATPVSIVVEALTDPADCPSIVNPASAVRADNETNTTNNSTLPVTIDIRCPNLDLNKVADATSVSRGDQIGFSIKVWNAGAGVAFDAVVTDVLPPGFNWDLDLGSSDLPAGRPANGCLVNDGTRTLTCALGNLAAGTTRAAPAAVIHLVATNTLTADCGGYDNTALVRADNDAGEDESATLTLLCPGLNMVKTADDERVEAGDPIGFKLEVTNTGPGVAMDVVVVDDLPDGLTWTFDEAGSILPVQADCAIAAGILTCNLGDLPATLDAPQASIHITAQTAVPAGNGNIGDCASYPNAASADPGNGDAVASEISTIDVRCPLDIELTKTGQNLAHVGDTVTYAFTVTNTGFVDLGDIELVDPICDAGTAVLIDDGDGDNSLEIDLDGEAPDLQREVWTYTCTRVVVVTDPDPLPNTALVQGIDADGRVTDDTASWVVDLIHPAIQVVKTVDNEAPAVGQTVTYTFVVTNTGDTTLSKVAVIDDKLGPIGTIDTLAPKASVTLTRTMLVLTSMAASPLRNVGTATGTDTLGKIVADDDDATIAAVEVLGIVVVAPTAELPRTGVPIQDLALNGLALMLLGLGLQRLRKRNPLT